MMRKPTV